MKRVLLIALAVVVAVSPMVIPAFAAESYMFSPDGNGFLGEVMPPEGTYVLQVYLDGVVFAYSDPVKIAYEETVEHGYTYLSCVCNFNWYDIATNDHLDPYRIRLLSAEGMNGVLFLPVDSDDIVKLPFSSVELIPYSEPAIPFVDRVGGVLGTVVGWISSLINSLVSPDGALHDLLPLMAVAISVSVLLIGVKVVRYFIDIRGS